MGGGVGRVMLRPSGVLVLYGSATGNAGEIARELGDEMGRLGLGPGVEVAACNDHHRAHGSGDASVGPVWLSVERRPVVFVLSTTGDGDAPDNCDRFVRWLRRKGHPPGMLEGVTYGVLALGDTNYTNFCATGRGVDGGMAVLGATRLLPLGEADDGTGLEAVVVPWRKAVCNELVRLAKERRAEGEGNGGRGGGVVPAAAPAAAPGGDRGRASLVETLQAEVGRWEAEVAELRAAAEKKTKRLAREDGLSQLASLPETSLSLAFDPPGGGRPEWPPPGWAEPVKEGDVTGDDMAVHLGGPTYSPRRPFLAPVTGARQLTRAGAVKSVWHVEVDLAGSGMKWRPGDSIGIMVPNPAEAVEATLAKLSDVDDGSYDAPVRLKAHGPAASLAGARAAREAAVYWGEHAACECHPRKAMPSEVFLAAKVREARSEAERALIPIHLSQQRALTPRQLLTHCLDLTGAPRKALLRLLAEHTGDEREKGRLLMMASREGKPGYDAMLSLRYGLTDLLAEFPSCRPPLAALASCLPPHQARMYSLNGSMLQHGSKASVAFSVVDFTPDRVPGSALPPRARKGVATTYLAKVGKMVSRNRLPAGSAALRAMPSFAAKDTVRLPVYLKPTSHFHLPDGAVPGDRPLLMIGPGTGVSPFIGFLEHLRANSKAAAGAAPPPAPALPSQAPAESMSSDRPSSSLHLGSAARVFVTVPLQLRLPVEQLEQLGVPAGGAEAPGRTKSAHVASSADGWATQKPLVRLSSSVWGTEIGWRVRCPDQVCTDPATGWVTAAYSKAEYKFLTQDGGDGNVRWDCDYDPVVPRCQVADMSGTENNVARVTLLRLAGPKADEFQLPIVYKVSNQDQHPPRGVSVVGSWNDWQLPATVLHPFTVHGQVKEFRGSVTVPRRPTSTPQEGTPVYTDSYEFKFQVDGRWCCDTSTCILRDINGNLNNIVHIVDDDNVNRVLNEARAENAASLDALSLYGRADPADAPTAAAPAAAPPLQVGNTLAGYPWLVFGCRHADRDFLYEGELREMERDGTLGRLDVAFSRDTDTKVYVQDVLRQHPEDVRAVLSAESGLVYVCGDGFAMAKDVNDALVEILSTGSEPMDAKSAAAYLQGLMKSGRYVRDIWC